MDGWPHCVHAGELQGCAAHMYASGLLYSWYHLLSWQPLQAPCSDDACFGPYRPAFTLQGYSQGDPSKRLPGSLVSNLSLIGMTGTLAWIGTSLLRA